MSNIDLEKLKREKYRKLCDNMKPTAEDLIFEKKLIKEYVPLAMKMYPGAKMTAQTDKTVKY